MRIASLAARLLLALVFVVFGLNGFLHFIHQPPPSGLALQYYTIMSESHILAFVFAIQLVGGLLLLIGRFVPLALALLAPVIVNILLFHLTMDLKDIGPALVVLILWLIVFYSVRSAFAGLFQVQTPVQAASA